MSDTESYCAWEQTLAGIEDPAIEREAFFRGALRFAEQRGWKSGWAYFVFVARYDAEPDWAWKGAGPVEPTPEHLEWMEAYYQRYAKSKRKKPSKRRTPSTVVDMHLWLKKRPASVRLH